MASIIDDDDDDEEEEEEEEVEDSTKGTKSSSSSSRSRNRRRYDCVSSRCSGMVTRDLAKNCRCIFVHAVNFGIVKIQNDACVEIIMKCLSVCVLVVENRM